MILKSQVGWALHCCAILAGLPDGRYLSTKALAEFHGLPRNISPKPCKACLRRALSIRRLTRRGGAVWRSHRQSLHFWMLSRRSRGPGGLSYAKISGPTIPAGRKATARMVSVRWRGSCGRPTKPGGQLCQGNTCLATILEQEMDLGIWVGTFDWVLKRAG